jgi:hypothetical protein
VGGSQRRYQGPDETTAHDLIEEESNELKLSRMGKEQEDCQAPLYAVRSVCLAGNHTVSHPINNLLQDTDLLTLPCRYTEFNTLYVIA